MPRKKNVFCVKLSAIQLHALVQFYAHHRGAIDPIADSAFKSIEAVYNLDLVPRELLVEAEKQHTEYRLEKPKHRVAPPIKRYPLLPRERPTRYNGFSID